MGRKRAVIFELAVLKTNGEIGTNLVIRIVVLCFVVCLNDEQLANLEDITQTYNDLKLVGSAELLWQFV